MNMIVQGIQEAFRLIITLDQEVFEVVTLSLKVSLISLFIATLVSIPLGIIFVRKEFKGKHFLMRMIYTLMGMPPVLCGLFVYIMFMRQGPFGSLRLNYTVTIMIIAQVLLIIPIILGLTINAVRDKEKRITMLAKTLGASRLDTFKLFIYEVRIGLLTAIISGFSRAISEVGAVMIVGGNIDGKTRVMTTYISQLKGMGEFERAVAVGIILLLISFTMNTILYNFQKEKSDIGEH